MYAIMMEELRLTMHKALLKCSLKRMLLVETGVSDNYSSIFIKTLDFPFLLIPCTVVFYQTFLFIRLFRSSTHHFLWATFWLMNGFISNEYCF